MVQESYSGSTLQGDSNSISTPPPVFFAQGLHEPLPYFSSSTLKDIQYLHTKSSSDLDVTDKGGLKQDSENEFYEHSQEEEDIVWYKRIGKALYIVKSSGRLQHIDGLRFFAAILVITSSVITTATKDVKLAEWLLYPFRSDFGIMLFLTICGRVAALRWILPQVGEEKKQEESKDHVALDMGSNKEIDNEKKQRSSTSQSDYNIEVIAKSFLERPFRFLLPVIIISAIQFRLCKNGKVGGESSSGFNYLFGVDLEAGPQNWCLANARDWMTTVVNLFTMETMSQELRQQTASLWIVPWLLQGTFYIYMVATFTWWLKKSSRLILFTVLIGFNWSTFSYLLPFLLGFMIAEESTTKRWKNGGPYYYVAYKLLCLLVLILSLFVKSIREPVNAGMANLQVLQNPFSYSWWSDYSMVHFTDALAAFCLIQLLEMSRNARSIFAWKPFALSGRILAPGMFVLHPIILWSLAPKLFTKDIAFVSENVFGSLGQVWTITFFFSILFAGLFFLFIEVPSRAFGSLFSRSFFLL